MTTYSFFATCARNLEPLLEHELQALGVGNPRQTRGGVHFEGELSEAYRVCLWSRLASRVLLMLRQFPAASEQALYEQILACDWSEHFTAQADFAVSVQTSRSAITHSHYAALKIKDAIVDQFRERSGQRPNVNLERPDIQLNLYLYRDQATLSLDLAGEALHRRGYRRDGAAAPMKENLASAILLRAGWPDIAAAGGALVDPMCGSGTLPIEAALMAGDIAPGLLRDYWGFLGWQQHDPHAWQALLDEAQQRRTAGLARLPDIRGYDHDPAAVRIAQHNVQLAGLQDWVHIEHYELDSVPATEASVPGLVVVNPPYGERLGSDDDLKALYACLGQLLKRRFCGWRAAVFTGNPDLTRELGLRSQREHRLYNGALECTLFHYLVEPAHYTLHTPYPRPLTREQFSDSARMLANRLQKNRKQLQRWLQREAIHCYRLYDADMPEYALAIDVYEGEQRWVHVQEYQAPKSVDPDKARLRLREALGVIIDTLELTPERLFFKLRRRQKGASQYEKLAQTGHFHMVQENGCRFRVNFEDYLDTGLFLDHRPTRTRIAELAAGKRFLNLFAYTGSATVYAAHGGALATTSVDMSKTYLDWARRNMQLNGFDGKQHEFIQANVLEWLEQAASQHRYDLIFLDPPSFSTSKRMSGTLDIQRDHVSLLHASCKLLDNDGLLIFSTNLRNFKLDSDNLAKLDIRDISKATIPPDFARNSRIHQCWEIRLRPRQRLGLKPES